jgi:hypothetical protein
MTPAGFEPIIPGSERPQTHALDRAFAGIGFKNLVLLITQSVVNPSEYHGPQSTLKIMGVLLGPQLIFMPFYIIKF